MSYASSINTKRARFYKTTSKREREGKKSRMKFHLLLQAPRGSGRDPAPPAVCTGSVASSHTAAPRSPQQQTDLLCSKEDH